MSTKTTFKRVALVAVAALGLGVVTSVPSNAAPAITYGVIADSVSGQGIIGGQATVVIALDTNTVTNIKVTGVGSVIGVSAQESTTVLGTPSTGSWTDSTTVIGAIASVSQTVTLTSAVAGVTTVTATPIDKVTGAPGTAVTKTVTWVTATTKGTYDHSYARISSDSSTAAATLYDNQAGVDSTTAELTFSSVVTGVALASVAVRQFNSADTSTTTSLDVAGTKSVVVAISGAGLIGASAATAGASATVAAATATDSAFRIWADGRNGKATITVTVNGVLVDTKYVNFFGTITGYAASTTTGETLSKKYIAIAAGTSGTDAESATVTIKGVDSLGVAQAPGTIYVTTDTATIASATVVSGVVYIYGVGLGTTNVNVCDTSACTSATKKYSFPITVVEKTAASYKVAFDATSYAPGAKVTWTVTATTKTGKPIADGSRAVLETSTVNMSAPAGIPSGTMTFVGGVATGSFFAPATAGDFVITTVEGNASDTYIAGIAASAAYTRATVPNTVTISSSADAAIDAANEAYDAANAATDAALQAADDASKASKAVAKLAKSVNKALAALKKQIAALTALVNKLP